MDRTERTMQMAMIVGYWDSAFIASEACNTQPMVDICLMCWVVEPGRRRCWCWCWLQGFSGLRKKRGDGGRVKKGDDASPIMYPDEMNAVINFRLPLKDQKKKKEDQYKRDER
jgi:hypothetical protein